MKNLITLVCCLFVYAGIAQKVKLKDANFACEEIQLPKKFIEKELKTYSAEISSNSKSIWDAGLSEVDLKETYLKLEGFQRVRENGDFIVKLFIGEMKVNKQELKDITVVKKGEKPKQRTYQYVFSYNFPISMKLMPMDALIVDKGFKSQGYTFTSPTFKSRTEAYDNRRSFYDEWVEDEIRKRVMSAVKDLKRTLNTTYGYPKRTGRYELMYAKTKKAPAYKPFEEEVMAMKGKLAALKANEVISDEFKQEVQTQVTAWGAKGDELSKDDKNLKKLKGAYLFNAMTASYIIDDLDNAEVFANKLLEAEREEKKAKRVLKRIKYLRETYPKSIVSSRHFAFDFEDEAIEDTTAGDREEYFADKEEEERRKKLGLHSKASEFKASITYKNDKVEEGIFVVDYRSFKDVVFFPGGNLKYFQVMDNKRIVEKRFDVSDVKHFSIGTRDFTVASRSGFSGGNELRVKVLEVLKKTERMSLFMRQPYSRDDMGANISFRGDYHIQKEGGKLQNLNSVSYNLSFKKKFSKYISDCPSLSERVLNGEFKVKEQDLYTIVNEYTDNCQ